MYLKMKKVNLNNLYESPYPPTDINTLWVDKDESTGKIRAIHKYNIAKGEWEPDMVSVDYMKPTESEDSNSFVVWTKEDFENSETRSIHMLRPNGSDPLDIEGYYCIVDTNWKCEDTAKEFIGMSNEPDRIHPTQKPVALYSWIFKNYAKPGFKILDTHLGSGSSRIAAYDAGLDFVGFEIDKDYFNKQEERFKKHISQISLFIDGEDEGGLLC